MTQLDMGKELRDLALSQTREGREERIAMIRGYLIAYHRDCSGIEVTADDVWNAAHELGLAEGDTRWLGSILRSWRLVENTHRYTPSERSVNHARPIPVFRWV